VKRTLALIALVLIGLSSAQKQTVTYTNPVIGFDFPDPFILRADAAYYAYATNGGGFDVQLARSTDLVKWDFLGDAMGGLPAWASAGWTWAPEVASVPGGYALYYTARHTESGRQCVGVAFAARPEGPFRDSSSEPLVCQFDEGGTIDASPFTDKDGKRYLYFKNDGNCCGQLTKIYVQRLSDDGLKMTGEAQELIFNTELWEGNVIEAPTVHRRGDKYYLFYSAADFSNDTYAVGYAYAPSPTGPFRKWKENPILKSAGLVAGPGHQCVFTDVGGQTWFGYHAWTAGSTGYPQGQRTMRIDRLDFRSDGVPVVKPTTATQAAPIMRR
jgi:beta-xylosidase